MGFEAEPEVFIQADSSDVLDDSEEWQVRLASCTFRRSTSLGALAFILIAYAENKLFMHEIGK